MLGEHGGCSCLKGSGRRASAYEGILSGAHSEAAMSASRADLEGRLPSGLPYAEMALGLCCCEVAMHITITSLMPAHQKY